VSDIAGTPALPNDNGGGSIGEASRQACEERQIGRLVVSTSILHW
jgi:hypothetical protein